MDRKTGESSVSQPSRNFGEHGLFAPERDFSCRFGINSLRGPERDFRMPAHNTLLMLEATLSFAGLGLISWQ